MRACQTTNTAVEDGIKLLARAKLNLYLELLGRRPDGFHEIRTLMQTVDLADTLHFFPRDDETCTLKLAGEGVDDIPVNDDNLVLRAANLFKEALLKRGQTFVGADITLTKYIPHGGGLGGGSSDAAATLQGLAEINDIETDCNLLFELAAKLGSDVPFFLRGGAVLCEGRGEVLTPIKTTNELHVVIVHSAPLSTAEVYGGYSKTAPPLFETQKPNWLSRSVVDLATLLDAEIVNHLEPSAFSIRPELQTIKEDFIKSGASNTAMSGSGSCIYGLTRDENLATRVSAQMRQLGYELTTTRTVDM